MFRWLADRWRRWVGGSEEPSGLSGAEVMEQMRASRATAADPAAWQAGVATLKTRVFSGMDRTRLWRRARRRYPGEVRELALIDTPDSHDLKALQDLLRDLER